MKNYATVVVNVASSGDSNEADKYIAVLTFLGPMGAFESDQLTSVRANAFNGCSKMTSLRLPNATQLYGYAANKCTSLENVDLPACLAVGDYAFNGCNVLTSVNLPVCEKLASSAFYLCSALTEIMLPKCTEINSKAFGFCTSLTKLTLGSPTMCTLEKIDVFRDIGTTIQVHVPADLVETYQADSVWSAVTGATLEFVAIS